MDRRKRQETALAAGLTALAGYVDALGFLTLGGLFVSFMSGNTTRLVVKAVQGSSTGEVHTLAALIAAFVAGGAAGSLVGRLAGGRRPAAVLLAVAVTLAAAGGLHLAGHDRPAAVVMALAMGMQNGVFEGDSGISALTYITGTLVKTGQQIVQVLFGGPPDSLVEHVLLWVGFVSGAALGAWGWRGVGLDGVWIAAGAALLLSGAAARLGPAKA
jgi:uncharacterized membrane protein YoaK (UPF0700 family)